MTKSPRKNVPDVGIELGAACMPSELASDRATAPGNIRLWDRLDKNPGFHGNRKRPLTCNGENDVSTFSLLFFYQIFFKLARNEDSIKSQTSFNFSQIRPLPTELGALERLKNFPQTYNGKMVSLS